MAGRRVYGGSEMTGFLQNENVSVSNFEALLSSSSSRAGFTGSRSMLNFEEGSSIEQQFYMPREIEETIDDDLDDAFHQPEKKRRLSTTQVQFLEKSFEVENKLEPERKIQLAKDLGLQPRQVAIWFQNRRARWKTKQLEKDYDALRSSYNALKVDYENMVKEKEKLNAEVVHLTDKLLLKEKHNSDAETFELNKLPDRSSPVYVKHCESEYIGAIKQEAQSSTNSAGSDSDSPHSTSRARTDSSNAFEAAHSDVSYVEEDEEVKEYEFLKLEDHLGNFDFPVEDHPLWSWP